MRERHELADTLRKLEKLAEELKRAGVFDSNAERLHILMELMKEQVPHENSDPSARPAR